MKRVLIIGAGLAGSVLARRLAEAGVPSLVIDRRDHVAGLCYSSRDEETGVDVHRYGPHIFHTNSERVWTFVQRFVPWVSWVNTIMATNARGVFSLPINLHTINQLYGTRLTPSQARSFIESKQDKSIINPANAEEQLLRFVGRDIYETFFRDYSTKQWGVSPREMPADIIKRIPIRFHYGENYYNDLYQGFPVGGYTLFVQRMLEHELIEVKTATPFDKAMEAEFAHTFYSGPIDAYFDYAAGELGYRTLDFRYERGRGTLQGCGCLNYTDMSETFTRGHEHKFFSPWEQHEHSVVVYEYSREAARGDDGYYPKRFAGDMRKLADYLKLVDQTERLSFIGRLGCYRYLDMHQVIASSLDYADRYLAALSRHELSELPKMSVNPL